MGLPLTGISETAAEGKLYDFQVVPAGTLFNSVPMSKMQKSGN
jgi:hypothetical protein